MLGKIRFHMIRRSRTLVALLALIALSAFLAESALALVCAPTMQACEAGMEACASETGPLTDFDAHAGAGHQSTPASHDSQSAPSDAPICPMAVAASGCVATALPAGGTIEPESVQHDVVLPSVDPAPDFVIVGGHFRPPRA